MIYIVSVSTKNTSPPLRTADEGQGVDGCREGDGVGKEGKVTEQELAIMFYHFIN